MESVSFNQSRHNIQQLFNELFIETDCYDVENAVFIFVVGFSDGLERSDQVQPGSNKIFDQNKIHTIKSITTAISSK